MDLLETIVVSKSVSGVHSSFLVAANWQCQIHKHTLVVTI